MVRAMVSDNHSPNMVAFKLLLKNLVILMMIYLQSTISQKSTCFMTLYIWLKT